MHLADRVAAADGKAPGVATDPAADSKRKSGQIPEETDRVPA
jgi:hypothetical protein